MFNRHWPLGYALFSLLYILLTLYAKHSLIALVKIIPILILLGYLYRSNHIKFPSFLKYGLIFSLVGDFILTYFAAKGFVFGLGAFFIAHIFYILCLIPLQWQKQSLMIALLALGYGGLVLVLIAPQLGGLAIPVVAYMIILFLMTLSALFSKQNNRWLTLGAISFLFSDSLIGLNKFYQPLEFASLLIMTSYYFAQFSLVKGFSKASQE